MRTERQQAAARREPRITQKGIALIAVTAALALLTIVTMEFNHSTNVDYASAANARDAMRAQFLARSIINMSELILKVQKLLDRSRKQLAALGLPDLQIADFMPMLETPMCGSKEELKGMASLAGIDADNIKGLGLDYGNCRVETFAAEDGKINLNCANGTPQSVNRIFLALTALVASPAYDPLFQERDGDGQITDRQTFVRALIDFVDRDEAGFGATGQPEDYGYEALREPYHAKNNYLDSVEELQLVRGMDDKKWEVFGPELTVYGKCAINVSATQSPIQLLAVLYGAAEDPSDPVLLDVRKALMLAQRIAQARAMGITYQDANAFVQFVADPDAMLGLKTTEGGGVGAQLGLAPVDGLKLNVGKFNGIAVAGLPRATYRVVAAAQVGRVEKRIIAVWDMNKLNQNNRDQAQGTGAWVYWREE